MIVSLIAVTAVLAACGSSADTDQSVSSGAAVVDDAVVAVGDAPSPGDGVGSLGDAVEVAAAAPGQANVVACDLDRQTMQLASEMYAALNGTPPVSEDDLLAQELLQEPSTLFDLDATGSVVAAPGSPCA